MTKNKKRSEKAKKTFSSYPELIGVLLLLVSILGIGKYGVVGKAIASFSLFLVGSLYVLLLAFVLFVGIYMIVKREKPDFFSSKYIGIFLMVIGVLVLLHKEYVIANGDSSKIITETIECLTDSINKIMNNGVSAGIFDFTVSNTGGGILGSLFATLFYKLFDADGTNIVIWVLLIVGFMIFTGLSIYDIITNTKNKMKDIMPKREKQVKEKEEDENFESYNEAYNDTKYKINNNNEYKMDKKVLDGENLKQDKKTVIKSIDDLKEKDLKVKEDIADTPIKVNSGGEQQIINEPLEVNKNYVLPSLDLLDMPNKSKQVNKAELEQNISSNSKKLTQTLRDFGIIGKVVEVNIGPSVVQYELQLQHGTKVSKILGLNREISLALAKRDVRIQAPIPGKSTIGIEMPNENSQMVTLRETLEDLNKHKLNHKLSVVAAALGKDIMGEVRWTEINKTPHLLVAGATGSGKSVCINCIILSILMNAKPDEVKLILVDPKKVELGVYNGIPHLLTPVVTDPKKANIALKRAVSEMERRYNLFEETKTKNIESYNEYVEAENKKFGYSETDKYKKLPYIVVIVDELADLMLVAGKEVEDSIMRITQMARAAGIHLIIATQRPSTDVITGLIKSNIPSRISFAVSSSIDSRTILDMTGAEKLLGKGDMLYLPMGEITPQRIQGAFVSEKEIIRVVDYCISQQKAIYDGNFLNLEDKDAEIKNNPVSGDEEEYDDPLYNDIVEFVITTGKASASLLQRRFKLGYNRAARIIDLLEERGIIGPQNGSKPREVLVKLEDDEPLDEE